MEKEDYNKWIGKTIIKVNGKKFTDDKRFAKVYELTINPLTKRIAFGIGNKHFADCILCKIYDHTDDINLGAITDAVLVGKYVGLAASASSRGIEFNISLKKLKSLLKVKNCFYTKTPFNETDPQRKRSIDRIDSSKGYIDSNVVACTTIINSAKGNLTVKEIIQMADKLKKLKL